MFVAYVDHDNLLQISYSNHVYLLQDLFRWWFKMKCAKGKFSVDSSSYAEVIERQKMQN